MPVKRIDPELLDLFQRRVAEGAVGASAMRNQGSKDVVRRVRAYLSDLNLGYFVVKREKLFRGRLDRHTELLRRRLPSGAKHWGTARKALTLFLQDITGSTL